jgi:hypothetical protein
MRSEENSGDLIGMNRTGTPKQFAILNDHPLAIDNEFRDKGHLSH